MRALLDLYREQSEYWNSESEEDQIANAAARNPSLPSKSLHRLLLSGDWPSAWANPAVGLCLLERPMLPFRRDLLLLSAAFHLTPVIPSSRLEEGGTLLTAEGLARLQETLADQLPDHPFTERWRDHLLAIAWPADWRDRTELPDILEDSYLAYDNHFGYSAREVFVNKFYLSGKTILGNSGQIIVDVSALRPRYFTKDSSE